ncbi:uncharacterized protein B0J16DRAFT_393941 [Fusarium flagelliforme]|nr:uncharacterized protein B0J16DRAFT_393941 [Fusarium flagelliforme]KAH7191873.1 hypothetical protein B0J16DRAFT_393941 [Fusarium flagelliforme]
METDGPVYFLQLHVDVDVPGLIERRFERTEILLHDQQGHQNLFEAKKTVGQLSKQDSILACINLHFSEGLRATDSLDYVYGLLAISKVPIEPDYTRSIREVYIEFVQWTLEAVSGNDSNIKRVYELLNRHAVGIRQLHHLPTWAPVFSASDKRHDMKLPHWLKSPSRYPFKSPFNKLLPPKITALGLWIKGVKAQTVETVHHEPGSSRFFYKGLSSFIHDFPKTYRDRGERRRRRYMDRNSILRALCYTFLIKHHIPYSPLYNPQRLFIALMASGHCRPEDFDRDLLESVCPSELKTITFEWGLATKRLSGSMIFVTENGNIGLIREQVLPGDVVYWLASGTSLTVLRPKDDHYLFVDNCFMVNLTDVEISNLVKSEQLKVEEIEIR